MCGAGAACAPGSRSCRHLLSALGLRAPGGRAPGGRAPGVAEALPRDGVAAGDGPAAEGGHHLAERRDHEVRAQIPAQRLLGYRDPVLALHPDVGAPVDDLDGGVRVVVLNGRDDLLDLIAHPQDGADRVLHDPSGMSYSTATWSSGWMPAAATVMSGGS